MNSWMSKVIEIEFPVKIRILNYFEASSDSNLLSGKTNCYRGHDHLFRKVKNNYRRDFWIRFFNATTFLSHHLPLAGEIARHQIQSVICFQDIESPIKEASDSNGQVFITRVNNIDLSRWETPLRKYRAQLS